MKRIKPVALIMSIVMLVTFTPLSLLQAAADGIKEIDFTQEKAISADVVDSVAEPMVDKGIRINGLLCANGKIDAPAWECDRILSNGVYGQSDIIE